MAANNPLIGKQIGNYRILAEINSGSFGSVYQGKHVIFEDDPMVAIKLLHTALRSQQEHAEFIKEAQVLRKLQHPHILRILDAGFQDGVPYLVTEYATGGSLRDHLKKSNGEPFPMDKAKVILTQVAQALHYAHERHIVHRDLKPENILFNQAGDALLADFGIAVLLASTRTGLVGVSGTPPYMAPEQFEGLASPKSDQYSLGCIAYELVTGHRLFTIINPTLEAYWFHHAKVEPTPPAHYHPQLPAHIGQAILTALVKDRTHRYSDILAFINALHEKVVPPFTAFIEEFRQNPKNSGEMIIEGKAHFTAKRYEEALTAYNQAIRLDPNNAVAYYNKGNSLGKLKRYNEALIAFDQAIRFNSNFALAYYNKGYTLGKLKRYDEALIALDQAIRLNPSKSTFRLFKETLLKENEKRNILGESIIYLDPNDELTRVRERIEEVPEGRITLMVPLQTQLRSNVGWRLIHARARELGKEILVISPDRQVRMVAKAAGFRVSLPQEDSSSSRAEGPTPSRNAIERRELQQQRSPVNQDPIDTVNEAEQAFEKARQFVDNGIPHPEAYCMKCKEKRAILNAHEVTTTNGRIAVQGACAVCGTQLFRMGRLALSYPQTPL